MGGRKVAISYNVISDGYKKDDIIIIMIMVVIIIIIIIIIIIAEKWSERTDIVLSINITHLSRNEEERLEMI